MLTGGATDGGTKYYIQLCKVRFVTKSLESFSRISCVHRPGPLLTAHTSTPVWQAALTTLGMLRFDIRDQSF